MSSRVHALWKITVENHKNRKNRKNLFIFFRFQPAAGSILLARSSKHHRHFRLIARGSAKRSEWARPIRTPQDRHLMMPSPSIRQRRNARHSCWLSAGSDQACISALHSIAAGRPISPPCAQIARSHQRIRPSFAASRARQPLQSSLNMPEPAAKSP